MPIDRRKPLGGIAGAGLATGCATSGNRPGPRGRPNILWPVIEGNGPFIGAYGDRLAHTPHIDSIARKGLLYRKVYANAPVCAPSRFCLLTGINPESNGPAHHMRADSTPPAFIQTYPQHLRAAG